MNYRDIGPEISAIAQRYNYKKPPDLLVTIQEWIEKALRFLSDLLSSFKIHVPGLADTPMVGNVMQVLIYIVGALSLFAILFFASKRMGQLNAMRQLARRGQSGSSLMLDASGWKREAERLAGQANWKESCRAVYMSCLRFLHESEIAEFSATRTNFEYWYVLSPLSARIAVSFKDLANRIESIWFGNQDALESDYKDCLAFLQEIEKQFDSMRQKLETDAMAGSR